MSMPTSDVLVIGGGIAGLSLALEVADHLSVTLIRPALDDTEASRWAQGGIAAVLSPDDDLEAHIHDTLVAGDGLCQEDAVRHTVTQGPAAIEWLIDCGVPFTPDTSSSAFYPYHLTREGGHSARRVIHADDATGLAVVTALLNKVNAHPNITQRNELTILGLLSDSNGRCIGAKGVDQQHHYYALLASHTVLATGGASGLYRHTTTPKPSSGEGMIMAAELGASLMNLEFQQFHPTCLYDPNGPAFLISEAVRGEGGYLLNESGQRFMLDIDPRAELAPRDVVARAIDLQIQHSTLGHVWLDIGHLGETFIRHHFPTIFAHCASRGIDIIHQPIPVVPAAHYSCGGVVTDHRGSTDVDCLYAIGEIACTGLHGANRMASNSLLECLVYARSCAQHLLSQQHHQPPTAPSPLPPPPQTDQVDSQELMQLRNRMRNVMSLHVSIVRSNQGLATAGEVLKSIKTQLKQIDTACTHPESIRLWQAISLCQLTVQAATQRHESRGLHYTVDWPETQSNARASRLIMQEVLAELAPWSMA